MFLRMIPNAKLEGKVKLHRTTSRRLRTGRRDRPRGEVWLEKQGIVLQTLYIYHQSWHMLLASV